MAVEGVDQLETYFGAYLPQFFYAMLAPLTLFAVLGFVNLPGGRRAADLRAADPRSHRRLVQRWAKKLLSRYWGQYTALGDTFLENLQGLTTAENLPGRRLQARGDERAEPRSSAKSP